VVALARLVRTRRRAGSGQSLVELALVAPALVFLTLGVLQLGLLAYAAAVARFAAFAGLRSAAVCGMADRGPTATAAAAAVVARAPGLRLDAVLITRVPLPLRGATAGGDRLGCRLAVIAPCVLPLPGLRRVGGSAVLPMEPAFTR